MQTTRRNGGWRPVTLGARVYLIILLFWVSCCFLARHCNSLAHTRRKCVLAGGGRRLGAVNNRHKATVYILPCARQTTSSGSSSGNSIINNHHGCRRVRTYMMAFSFFRILDWGSPGRSLWGIASYQVLWRFVAHTNQGGQHHSIYVMCVLSAARPLRIGRRFLHHSFDASFLVYNLLRWSATYSVTLADAKHQHVPCPADPPGLWSESCRTGPHHGIFPDVEHPCSTTPKSAIMIE